MKNLLIKLPVLFLFAISANYAYTQNLDGKKWIGGGLSVTLANLNPNAQSRPEVAKNNQFNFSINAIIGKFKKEKTLFGYMPSYTFNSNQSSKSYPNEPNVEHVNNSKLTDNYFGLGVFVRQHFRLFSDRLNWWLQPSVSYNFSVRKNIDENSSHSLSSNSYYTSYTKFTSYTNAINAGFAAGLTYYINRNFALSTTFNMVSAGYSFGQKQHESLNHYSNDPGLPPADETVVKNNGFTGAFAPAANIANTISLNYIF
ncbi:MAG: hypothetical protein H7296_02595 [Bacteroidia bacterium]|nr:hypothetical protein [Bacteroidia bacterium]